MEGYKELNPNSSREKDGFLRLPGDHPSKATIRAGQYYFFISAYRQKAPKQNSAL
jgi:hypothetical protein